MALNPITVGAAPNDGTGDPHRTAFAKANANDQALFGFLRLLAGVQGMANSTDAQDWFSTAPALDLEPDSVYEFAGMLSSVNGAVSHGLNLSFAPIAGASIRWAATGAKVTDTAQATAVRYASSDSFDTARLVTTASTVAGNIVQVNGLVWTTTAGQLRPRIAQSAITGSFTLNAGTFFRARRLGPASLTNVGWAPS